MTDIAKLRTKIGELCNIIVNGGLTVFGVKSLMESINEMESYYQEKIEKLESKVYNFKDTTKMYEDLTNKQASDIKELQKEDSELRIKIDFLEDEKEGFRKETQELKTKNEKIERREKFLLTRIQAKIVKISQLIKENEGLSLRIEQQRNTIENLIRENETLKEIKKAHEYGDNQYKHIVTTLNAEIKELKDSLQREKEWSC